MIAGQRSPFTDFGDSGAAEGGPGVDLDLKQGEVNVPLTARLAGTAEIEIAVWRGTATLHCNHSECIDFPGVRRIRAELPELRILDFGEDVRGFQGSAAAFNSRL